MTPSPSGQPSPAPTDSATDQAAFSLEGPCLDTAQLADLEQAFRQWCEASGRRDVRLSRRRILLVFLLIRYTGAKLSEILRLDPFQDIGPRTVCIHDGEGGLPCTRSIAIAQSLARELTDMLADPEFRRSLTNRLAVDPAFVRRKFYERAAACGLAKHLAGPEMIRRARAVELLRGHMPLPAVQRLLGHATPPLAAAQASFTEEELNRATKVYVEREFVRKTSARNTFFGKIAAIESGDVQARVRLATVSGLSVVAMITRESLGRLGLYPGQLVTAEVKAPWIVLLRAAAAENCVTDNRFHGRVTRINRGKVSLECVLRVDDHTELCALTSIGSDELLNLAVGDEAWAVFSAFSVILHADD